MTFRGFQRDVSFAPGAAGERQISAGLAVFAREALLEAIREGAGTDLYIRAVNGRRGAPEASVTAPGPIVYRFDWVREATAAALAILRRQAPSRSGRYRQSFFVLADGREVPVAGIPLGAEVMVSNDQPYTRKIQVGSTGFESSRGLFEVARQHVLREYRGLVKVELRFVQLSGGYVLKGRRPRRRAAQSNRSSAFRGGRAYLSQRQDTAAGQRLTYPALILRTQLTGFGTS